MSGGRDGRAVWRAAWIRRVVSLVVGVAVIVTGSEVFPDAAKAIAAFIAIIVGVVVVHELGHFVVGKLSGVRVDEFSVGFGPRLASVRLGETLYALRAIPAGGFVRLAGMTGLEHDGAGERSFYRASIPRRMATLAAGGLVNLLLAGILFGITNIPSVPSLVAPQTGAARAGMQSGDQITAINGHGVNTAQPDRLISSLHAATDASNGSAISITVVPDDGGNPRTLSVVPQLTLYNNVGDPGDASGGAALPQGQLVITAVNGTAVGNGTPAQLLGNGGAVSVSGQDRADPPHAFSDVTVRHITTASDANVDGELGRLEAAWRIGYSPGSPSENPAVALFDGITSVPAAIGTTVAGISSVVSTPGSGGITGPEGASGPVGIYTATAAASREGWIDVVGLAGLISLSLGVLNLLPIPFLDGGRFAFIVLEAVRRRRVDPKIEAMVHVAGLAVIMSFAIYITIFGDIGRLLHQS